MIDLGIPGLGLATVVGKGGFSTVYCAQEQVTERTVAVKVLSESLGDSARLAFQREAGALGALSQHPKIVAVYRAAINRLGSPYLVMPFYRNGSLLSRLSEDGPFSPGRSLAVVRDILEALDAAHEANIIHCDVKPANVMIDDYGGTQLMDFGVCRFASPALRPGPILGTISYSAPEVLRGQTPDVVSDLFSVGVTAFAMLHGHQPYPAASQPAAPELFAAEIERSGAPSLEEFGDSNLSALVAALLAPHRDDRPSSAHEALVSLPSASGSPPSETTGGSGPVAVDAWWRRLGDQHRSTRDEQEWWNADVE